MEDRRKMIEMELEKEKQKLFLARSVKDVRRIQKRIAFLERLLLS